MQDKNRANVKKRLKTIAALKKIKDIRTLASFLGVNESRLYAWIKRDLIVDPDIILGKFPDINAEWLMSGTGEPLKKYNAGTTATGQAINTGPATVNGRGIGKVYIASVVETQPTRKEDENSIQVTDFERQVIEGMRKYFPLARWEAIAAEIEAEKKKYG
ncbi:MAG: hypothetical protein EOL92_00385 [Bacteroidia bacterium]|nr:hypothetical protein [Bacteroidia bacterium]